MSFLKRIAQIKKEEVRKGRDHKRRLRELVEKRKVFPSFEDALKKEGTKIIAEVKRASPSAGEIKNVSASEQAIVYQRAGAVAVSVLTDRAFFKGSLEDLRDVRQKVNIPILRKDFVIDPIQIEEAKAFGADGILLIVRMLDGESLKDLIAYSYELSLMPLVEVFNLQEAELALKYGAKIIGINNRDLDTFKVDISLSKSLSLNIKKMGVNTLVAESGIDTRQDIEELQSLGVDAFLVGTSLMKSEDPAKKLKELLGFNV
ncbi:MAG: indole-3-glycerol phosphate synthase TrpC [Aquificaceae bacterium]